ncbi:hypothetical protein FA10DRAFT_198978 [Acaromyces ingoldii]|uniref:Glycosyltransferase n=1 Tax=Acaromyces ingoldii TaxID=215250 RepID=A0A316YF53_9BASI|nr:hypothetical protein FA10DRAFT_198978 [Acaromyces ingoldii]PWN87268.1 hypothetical protein FA10DRAFT_198978 [Acaromyces ingoldii]
MEATALHHICVVAKYPYLGTVKTRLEPALGKGGARDFAELALIETLQSFVGVALSRLVWSYAPAVAQADVERLLRDNDLSQDCDAQPQPDAGDLGDRLAAAVASCSRPMKAATGTCTLVGTDCFALKREHVHRAIQRVQDGLGKTAYMIPASDGGYVLLTVPLGLDSAKAFGNIRWSCPQTAEDQSRRLSELGLDVELGPTLQDVDEPGDLASVVEGDSTSFPRTRQWLARWSLLDTHGHGQGIGKAVQGR